MKNHITTSQTLKHCLRAIFGIALLCALFPLNASAESPPPCLVASAECFDANDCNDGEVCKVGVVFSQNSSCTMNFCTEKQKEDPCSMEPLECVTDSDCSPTDLCTFENNNGCPVSSCVPAEETLCPGFYLQCTEDSQCNADEECLIIPASDDCLISLCVPAEEQLICPDVLPECYVDADCGFGGTCIEDPECGAHTCETTEMLCDDSADCGDCMSCVYGVCQSTVEVECTNDFYCGDGLVCSPCGQCVPLLIDLPQCATTEDCGGCLSECMWGFCVTVQPECKEDFHCAEGDVCSECGTCEPGKKPECDENSDCGPCFGLCIEGECFFTGALECEYDEDCGLNFICGECGQCEKDPEFSNVTLCIESGGKWDPMSCGHYDCGNPSPCAAIIPGCDCGSGANFIGGKGCVADSTCAPEPECTQNADCGECFGVCIDGQCEATGDIECESDLDCGGNTPWCNVCGQCEEDGYVRNPMIDLCHDTGGLWMQSSCGHYNCGEAPICEADIPGCDCGPGFSFTGDQGCEFDATCIEAECEVDGDCPGDCGVCGNGVCSIDENCSTPGPNPMVCDEDLDCNGEYCSGACDAGICVDWICTPDDKTISPEGTPLVLGAGTVGGCATQGGSQNTGFILFTLLSILALGRVRESN